MSSASFITVASAEAALTGPAVVVVASMHHEEIVGILRAMDVEEFLVAP